MAIEEVFYSVNAKSALKLGQVRGVALLAAARQGLPVAEYAPLKIKSSVVGYGLAKKEQVQFMVARLLGLAELPQPADAADALAIAICHIHTAQTLLLRGRRDESGAGWLRDWLRWLLPAQGQAVPAPDPVFQMDFTNPNLSPSHWTLTLHPDGQRPFPLRTGHGADPQGSRRRASIATSR